MTTYDLTRIPAEIKNLMNHFIKNTPINLDINQLILALKSHPIREFIFDNNDNLKSLDLLLELQTKYIKQDYNFRIRRTDPEYKPNYDGYASE